MKKLYNKIYYVVSFSPKRTVNAKVFGTDHYMTNKELAKMRTNEVLKFITLGNVITIETYKLKQWITQKILRRRPQNISDWHPVNFVTSFITIEPNEKQNLNLELSSGLAPFPLRGVR